MSGTDGPTPSLEVCGPEERFLPAGVAPSPESSFLLGLRDLGVARESWLLPRSRELPSRELSTGTGRRPVVARGSFSSGWRNVAPAPSNTARSLELRPNHFTGLRACLRFCSNVKGR